MYVKLDGYVGSWPILWLLLMWHKNCMFVGDSSVNSWIRDEPVVGLWRVVSIWIVNVVQVKCNRISGNRFNMLWGRALKAPPPQQPAVIRNNFYRGLIISYPNWGVEILKISTSTLILDPNRHVLLSYPKACRQS